MFWDTCLALRCLTSPQNGGKTVCVWCSLMEQFQQHQFSKQQCAATLDNPQKVFHRDYLSSRKYFQNCSMGYLKYGHCLWKDLLLLIYFKCLFQGCEHHKSDSFCLNFTGMKADISETDFFQKLDQIQTICSILRNNWNDECVSHLDQGFSSSSQKLTSKVFCSSFPSIVWSHVEDLLCSICL